MSIDFLFIQKQFEDLHEQGAIPTSVTIAEADYDAFFESMWPARKEDAFERDLLGVDRLAELDAQREEGKRTLAKIVNYVDMSYVLLVRDPNAASGTFGMEWIE